MNRKLKKINLELLNYNERRVFRIFGIILIVAIAVLTISAIVMLYLNAYSSFFICLVEIVFYFAIYKLNQTNYYLLSRYVFFLAANVGITFGSLYHGSNGGVEFFFFSTAIVPILFFDKLWEYLSLFSLSALCYVAVNLLYDTIPASIPFHTKDLFPYYSNIVTVVILVFLCCVLFKFEHLAYEYKLQTKQADLTELKNKLESHLEQRTKEVEEQGKSIKQFAFLNAHKVRAPLARIRGLIYLSELENLKDDKTRELYMQKIKQNADELNKILQEVTGVLSTPPPPPPPERSPFTPHSHP